MIQIQTLAGVPDAAAKADAIIALETKIATAHWAPKNPRCGRHQQPDVGGQAAGAGASVRLAGHAEPCGPCQGRSGDRPGALDVPGGGVLLDTVPLQTWKDYLAYHFVRTHAQFLPKAFDQANFEFFSHTLRDVPQQRERWKRGVQLLNRFQGEEIGKIYVARHYPPEAERKADELIADLRAAYGERIKTAAWMDEPTRKQALIKLSTFDPRLGHPVKYIDYSSLKIDRNDLLGTPSARKTSSGSSACRASQARRSQPLVHDAPGGERLLRSAEQPDHLPGGDPAAALFRSQGRRRRQLWREGATIGHEMGHGFDDQGRQFDSVGKVRDWWTAGSAKAFAERAAVLGKQFDAYEPVAGVHINGELTMGENLGTSEAWRPPMSAIAATSPSTASRR
uniref:Peptidase M13 C-terminal domain-containing protein n=1 Tax=Phenylobacterium glaciei TaxID=2803784 RepID=A0A974S7Q0_9CAUL|nr:hypothetical protein JKL49_16045 [Phenylobacterium glaciei]